jgi:hypothetical protein
MQTLARSMPDFHKTLILARVRDLRQGDESASAVGGRYVVDEMALATEHAPFRHKNTRKEVGSQRKKQKTEEEEDESISPESDRGDGKTNERVKS